MSEVNYRSPSYGVAYMQGICAQCGASTRLVALVLPPGHEVFEPEDEPEAREESTGGARGDSDAALGNGGGDRDAAIGNGGGACGDGGGARAEEREARCAEGDGDGVWSVATGNAFLFFLECIPEPVLQRMHAYAPAYRLNSPAEAPLCEAGASAADDAPHWANHCDACGGAFDDDQLFGEPGGGFLPTSEAEARLIQLVPVNEPLEAGAGGYAYEPQYFDCMRRG